MLAWQDHNLSLLEKVLWFSADQSQEHLGELKQLILLELKYDTNSYLWLQNGSRTVAI